ncbi:MAG: oxalyl-CoA decarboxylase [Burkholderiaceae bacterium]|nr:oxalyl-CoA decarboxylase [Burkholderiaceae bacterium]
MLTATKEHSANSTAEDAPLTDGFHLVIDALKANDIDTIFGLVGIPITDLARLAQAEGMRFIGFRHEQHAGNAAAIAGYMTQKPGICLTVSAPGLGKGAAYAQADQEIKDLVEKSGIPYLPMSMAKGLLPDTHPQCASAARSFVLSEADTVMLIGARLNWLLAHGKGKTWGNHLKKFIQIDIAPTEIDSNVPIAAPVIGDVGSCVNELLKQIASVPKPSSEWLSAIKEKSDKNIAKMEETLSKNPSPMNFHSALRVIRDVVKANPDVNIVNEGANTLDYARSIVNMYKPRKRFDSGTWGIMGIGMGYAIGAAVVSKQPVIAIEGDSAFGFSGMELETICRYNLPIITVVFNNNGVYRGTDVNPTGGADVAPTVFVKNARYDKMMEAFGGVGFNATTPQELMDALNQSLASGKPTVINAVIDETAGTESGRLTNLNPASTATKK